MQLISNAVKGDQLKELYVQILDDLAAALEKSYGPSGSNTLIQKGAQVFPEYTKDGHTILSNIKYNNIIEQTITSNILSITEYIAKTVGDGTTSAVLMSDSILKLFMELQEKYPHVAPVKFIQRFNYITKGICNEIRKHRKDFTDEDAFAISMISTNGDKEISQDIYQLYKKLGNDVYINLDIANNVKDVVNIYDGLVLESGLIEECYINDPIKRVSHINKPHIYAFKDPVDTIQMVNFFDTIIKNNILNPMKAKQEPIPTVIITPKMSRDVSPIMTVIMQSMAQYNGAFISMRPPLLIITNIDSPDQDMYSDICQMCGCPLIMKPIDRRIEEKFVAEGKYPTVETICDFYGTCEYVEADQYKTSFIRPAKMIDSVDDDGNVKYSEDYKNLVAFLEDEIKKAYENKESVVTIHGLKKRVNSLKGAFVDWYVGGLSPADRDARKASIEDAIKNCRSAAINGVGYGANFEGYRAVKDILNRGTIDIDPENELRQNLGFGKFNDDFIEGICKAYEDLITKLMSGSYNTDEIPEMLEKMYKDGKPINLDPSNEYPVLSSIESDICVLDAINKIISIMATSNQYLCPEPIDTAPYRADANIRKRKAEQEANK